jgi:hypothetical protein
MKNYGGDIILAIRYPSPPRHLVLPDVLVI